MLCSPPIYGSTHQRYHSHFADNLGNTPLHLSALWCSGQIPCILIACGGFNTLTQENHAGLSPISLALLHTNTEWLVCVADAVNSNDCPLDISHSVNTALLIVNSLRRSLCDIGFSSSDVHYDGIMHLLCVDPRSLRSILDDGSQICMRDHAFEVVSAASDSQACQWITSRGVHGIQHSEYGIHRDSMGRTLLHVAGKHPVGMLLAASISQAKRQSYVFIVVFWYPAARRMEQTLSAIISIGSNEGNLDALLFAFDSGGVLPLFRALEVRLCLEIV